MINEVKAYILECDNCKVLYEDDYSIWVSETDALDSAKENDWIEYEGKHYCPDCYAEFTDGEVIISKEREGSDE